MRLAVEHYLNNDQDLVEEFGYWAFGSKFKIFSSSIQFMDAWNELHGKTLKLHKNDGIDDTMKQMIEMFKRYREEDGKSITI